MIVLLLVGCVFTFVSGASWIASEPHYDECRQLIWQAINEQACASATSWHMLAQLCALAGLAWICLAGFGALVGARSRRGLAPLNTGHDGGTEVE